MQKQFHSHFFPFIYYYLLLSQHWDLKKNVLGYLTLSFHNPLKVVDLITVTHALIHSKRQKSDL